MWSTPDYLGLGAQAEVAAGEEQGGAGVFEYGFETFFGVAGIERNVGRAGDHDGEHGAEHFGRTLDRDAAESAGGEALLDQLGGEGAGVGGELRVGPGGAGAFERNAVRVELCAAQEGGGNGLERAEVDGCIVPRCKEFGVLGGGDQG